MKDDIFDTFVPYLAILITTVLVILSLSWAVQGNEFFLVRVFSPKMEQVRRETFEQSKAYNEGMIQELRKVQSEYIRATPEQQVALRSVVLHQFAAYDEKKLPSDLQEFLFDLRKVQSEVH